MQLFQRKFFGSGMTILVISNEEMDNIMKIIKPLVDDGSFIKGNSETTENEGKNKKLDFLVCY